MGVEAAARGSREFRRAVTACSTRILLVDDDAGMRDRLCHVLSSDGYAVTAVLGPHPALSFLDEHPADLLAVDVRLEGFIDGIALARQAKARRPDLRAVVYTRFGSESEEADVLRLGASDYVVLPGYPHDVLVVRNAVRTALQGLHLASSGSPRGTTPDRMIYASSAMWGVVRQIHCLAAGDGTCLISGETGTGKELVARALHVGSPRERGPFVAVNCGALATSLAEATFFGSVKGAYTGSETDRRGLIEEANGGTLFLDELGELPRTLQPLLLRFLDRGEFQRVGEAATRYADVRVIAATNRSVSAELLAGTFRQDLFYRFARVLDVAPLRERLADLDALVVHWCETRALGGRHLQLTAAALDRLHAHPWPGNVRELRNVLERASELAFGGIIDRAQLDRALGSSNGLQQQVASISGGSSPVALSAERARILAALHQHHWERARAAASLGISRWSLWRRMKELNIGE